MNEFEKTIESEAADAAAAIGGTPQLDALSAAQSALYDNPIGETDGEKLLKAKRLAMQMEGLAILQGREQDAKDDDATKFAKAMTLAETLVGDRAKDDVFLRMWSPDGRDFPNGQAALDHMRRIFAHPEEGYEKRFREVSAMTYDQQVEEAMKDRETLEILSHAGGSAMNGIMDALNMGEFRRPDKPIAPGKATGIGAANPNAVEVTDVESEEYRRRVHDTFMSKLARRARWANIAAIANSKILQEEPNAPEILRGVLESADNAVRVEDYAKFAGLSDEAKELVIRARQVMKPDEPGDFGNWCLDMAATGINTALNVVTAGYRQSEKQIGVPLANALFDAGIDVNELNRRRQYLWAATGRFAAGGDASGELPQLQFERRCEDYGLIGDALIGAVSCVGYMTTVAQGPVGIAAMALEGMQQMDDHVAAAGGDITDPNYQLSSAIFGGLYAYTERLQFGGFLKDWTDMQIRKAFLKGMLRFIAKNPKEYAKRLAAQGFSESVEEGLQAGMLGVNEALALDKNAAREFGEQFVHDFTESLGTMFVVGVGGDIRHHARASGYRFGDKGAATRMINFTHLAKYELEANKLKDAGAKEVAERSEKRVERYADEYGLYKKSGIGAVARKLDLTDGEASALEDMYKEMEALFTVRDGASKAEFDRIMKAVSAKATVLKDMLSGKIAEEVEKENAEAREGREKRAEEWLQRRELSEDREIWARGNMLVTVTTKDGKPVVETDLGAAMLEKSGYTKRQAEILSKYFRYERQMGYSPAAVESMRALYDRATKSQTTFAEAIAATFPGGTVERRDGRTFIRFKAGEDGKTIGVAELVEDSALDDGHPDFSLANPNVATSVENATGGKVTAQKWLEMSPEDRERTWTENGLYMRGSFHIVIPDTGTKVSFADVQHFGRIALRPKDLSQAGWSSEDEGYTDQRIVFHEYFHGFVKFAREVGMISDKDVKALVEMFGEARPGVQELFNEESAADAFRDYLVRRRAGSLTENTPANRTLWRLFSFGKKVAQEGEKRIAEAKAAQNGMDALFDQILLGRWQGMAEAQKKEEKAGNKDQGAEIGEEETGNTEEQNTKEEAEKPAEEKNPVPQQPKSDRWEAAVPKSPYRVRGHYQILKLSEVIHSRHPLYAAHKDWQNRIGENKLAEASLQQIKDAFYWKAYGDSAFTDTGAPIVLIAEDAEGKLRPFVVSGNGRVMVLNSLLEDHMYDRYRNGLKEMAAAMGLEVPEDGEEYVLVRVIDDLGGISIDEFVTKSNGDNKRKVGDAARAKQDAATIVANGLASLYKSNADGTPDMTPGVNDEFFRLFSQRATDGDAIYDENFNVVEEGKNRVMRALLYVSCGQGDRGPETVDKVILMTDTLGIRRQRNAMECCAAPVAALEANPDYAIGADVSRAMADYMEFVEKKRSGKIGTFDEFLGEQDMFDPRSEIAEGILRLLGGSKNAREIADVVKRYCDIAVKSDADGGLQGAEAARTREDVWHEAVKAEAAKDESARHSISARVDAALEQGGFGQIGKERRERAYARYSFAAANPVKLTSKDIDLAISEWGRTDDINKGIYFLPDGTMLQGKGTVMVLRGKRIELFGHDGWIDLILKNAPKVDMKTPEGVAEAGGQIEAAQRGIAALGAIRIASDKNGFTISKEPTAAQYDALYDMAEKAYQVMDRNGDDEMYVDVTDENLNTLFTLTYARGTAPRKMIEDLRSWYERGEKPGERQPSLVAMFHGDDYRFSISGQKRLDAEYPDAGQEFNVLPDARLSIGDLRQMLYSRRPDLPPEDIEAYLDEIRGYEKPKKQKLAVHWLITGAIELPEDSYKLDKAIATAERAKVDPFQYRNPEDIFAAFPQHLPKDPAIDPDTVAELTDKEDRGHGVTVYTLSEKIVKDKRRAGQIAMRKIINTHWGKDASPWCLLRGDENGELTEDSRGYWEHYSALPKKVAFLNGRLLAFMATDERKYDPESFAEDFSQPFSREYPELVSEYEAWLEEQGDDGDWATLHEWLEVNHPEELAEYESSVPEKWWDRKDASHAGIPVSGLIPGDELGRSGVRELKDGKLVLVGRTWRGNKRNGTYEEWTGSVKTLQEEYANGKLDGTKTVWHSDGTLERVTGYKEGKPVGWLRTYFEKGSLRSVEHFSATSEHDRPFLQFDENGGLYTIIEYGEHDRHSKSARFDESGNVTAYQEAEVPGGLPKLAYTKEPGGLNLLWKSDDGNTYDVYIKPDGIDRVHVRANGSIFTNDIAMSRDEYKALPEDLRKRLEGESAAVRETIESAGRDLYDGNSLRAPDAGARNSFGMGRFYRNREETERHIEKLNMLSRKAEAYGEDLVRWLPTLKEWGLTPITRHDLFSIRFGNGQIHQGGGSVPRSESEVNRITGEMGDWVRGFMRRAKTDLMLSEMESDEFDLQDGVLIPRKGAHVGEIGRMIRRDIAPVPYEAAQKLEGFDAYFGLTARYGQEARGLAACFKETEGFHAELQRLKAEIEAERRLGKDKGISGRPVPLDQMGVNRANEGRVIGATPVEDWVGGERNYERLRREISQGVTTARLWEIVDRLKNLPKLRVDESERTYLERAGRLILATQGRVADPVLCKEAWQVARDLAKELVTDDVIAHIKADIDASKATAVQMSYVRRFNDHSWLACWLTSEIANRLIEDGYDVNSKPYRFFPFNSIGSNNYHFVGHPVIVDDLFSDDLSDIPLTVEGQKRYYNTESATVVFGFGTKTGSRFAIPSAELTQLLKDAKISPTKLKNVLGYEIQKATGPEIRRLLRRVHAGWQDYEVLVGSRLASRRGQHDSDGVHGESEVLRGHLDGVFGLRGLQREVLHGLRGVQERNGSQLESRLNDDSRWSIASRELDWDALPDSLDRVIFNTSVQHFTGQDKLPRQYEQFKVYRDHGLLEIARPQVEGLAKGTGAAKWLGKYLLGKYYGDLGAAKEVVRHRISPNRLEAVRGILLPKDPVYWVYVRNDDGRRTNRLPEAYADLLAERYGGTVENGIAKVSDERNTSADMKTRAQREFQFKGEPIKGAQYVIVDDVWTTGSTATSLIEYLAGNGANVRGVTTLAVASHGAAIRPTDEQIAKTLRKAGIGKPEDGLDLAGVDIRRATGSELQAYLTGAKPGAYGFVDWFDPSANSLGLDFRSKGENGGTMPMMDWTSDYARPVRQGVFDFGDDARSVEGLARWSYGARLADGDAEAAERAIVNQMAYLKLTLGSTPRPKTIARLGLTLGMKAVSPKRILDEAEKVAKKARGTVIEKAARNGDAGTALSLMERQRERENELNALISGGAKAGGNLVLGGVVAQDTLLGKRIEQTMRTMTAADLADMEGDTGIDIAAEILENDPKAFDEELKPTKPKRGEDDGAESGEDEGGEDVIGDDGLTDRDRWKREQAKKEAAKRVREFVERAKKRAEENKDKAAKRREENRQRVIEGEKPVEPGMGDTVGGEKYDAPEKSVAGFKNKWEFAAFVREWAKDKYQKTHGTTSLGKSEENRLFAEFYRRCAAKMLQDLADKLLDPKGARAWANRRIGELEKGMRPDTIERMSADIFAFINRNAIREERGKLIEKFRKEIQQFITGAEFEELKQDSTRRLTGWVEEAARYMMKACQLSAWASNGHASAFEKERNELLAEIEKRREVYDGSGKSEEYMEENDAGIVRARWKLALLEQYGGMSQMMPGQIENLKQDAIRYLTEEAVALEERWKDTKALQDRLRRSIAGAIVGPNGQRYESKTGYFGHLFDGLNGLIRLRLKHLMRFAGKKERADGEAAINEIVTMLGRGEVEYARAVQRDRRELFAALGRIFQDANGNPNRKAIRDYLKRMEEYIPSELSRQLSNQGFAERMTYGQMLQLLVSIEQKSYAENVRVCGRGSQAELIRNSDAFTQADSLFIDWLRAFYEAKREEISKVTLRMVGNKVESPDPLYCPVKVYRGELAKDLHIDAGRWNAIDDVLSRRVMHLRDFDESATILGQFYDRSNRMAGLIAWAESGTIIQNVICSGAVQQQINLAFGSGESSKIRRQLEDTFNGGTSRSKTPGEIVFMDKAMNFVTFGYLGFNPLSAMKQVTSFTVWANVLPGGFRELWHHMTHIDREAVRHIMESDEYKVRYGDDTGSGQDFATKALNENVGMNPFMRLMTGPGMWLLKKGDFLPGVWIMQGVYKSLLNKHLNEGMEENAADRLAMTEAFNLLEETQQSGRTYNTSALAREHGRLGSALVQFATSPLQQLQYETQALREWMDLRRYGADPERIAEARAKLVRAAFINHVLLPAAMELVISVFKAIIGDEPKWEKDDYACDLLRDVLLGQASRIFYVGVLASSMIDALFKRKLPRGGQLIPSEGAITVLSNVAITAHDIVMLDGDKIQKDLERIMKSLAPTRIPYNIYRRLTGDSDADRKRKEAAKRK